MGKHGCSSCVWKETHTEGDLNIGMTRISTVCLNHLDRDRQRSLKQIVRISGFYICPLTARIQWWLNPQFTSSRISPSSDFVSSAYCRSKLLQNRTWDPFLNIAFEYNSELCGATTSDLLLLIVNNWPFFVVVGFFLGLTLISYSRLKEKQNLDSVLTAALWQHSLQGHAPYCDNSLLTICCVIQRTLK